MGIGFRLNYHTPHRLKYVQNEILPFFSLIKHLNNHKQLLTTYMFQQYLSQ